MKRNLRKFGVTFLLAAFVFASSSAAQEPGESAPAIETYQQIQEAACIAQPISRSRTYAFRTLETPTGKTGWFGKKPWYASVIKILPFVSYDSPDKYSQDDIRLLQYSYGKPAPLNETANSKRIRLDFEAKLKTVQMKNDADWAQLPQFDWRERGLDVGEVGFQGWECNSCWAFATLDALQISRRLMAIRAGKNDFSETLRPSVRQLISCMIPKTADHCKENWHGDAFTFMVERGLPLGGSRKYDQEKFGWTCNAEKFLKALTWDYITARAPEISSAADIKRAVVTYGAVVAVMKLDKCFALYGEGVFNEESKRGGNHLVLIIGWNDAKGAWLIKNSFGKDWGENGFGWMKYDANTIGRFSAVVVADPREETRIAKETQSEP